MSETCCHNNIPTFIHCCVLRVIKKIVLLLDKRRLYVDFGPSVRICLARDSKN